jgi:IS5 family transposase
MKQTSKAPQQLSFSSYEFAQKKRVTRREKFLSEMEQVVPWADLEALVEAEYPTAGRVVRQPIGVSRMLRMYFLQQWFGLADEAVEDAIYDSQSMRDFVAIDLARETVPDATTLLKFRRLLEEKALTKKIFEASMRISQPRVCCCARARWSTPPSLPQRLRPRTRARPATLKCIKPGRATSGISG